MRIKDKTKFIARMLEMLVVILTIILTPMAINYSTILRGHAAYGGEYLIPILGLLIILVIETIYEENKRRKI